MPRFITACSAKMSGTASQASEGSSPGGTSATASTMTTSTGTRSSTSRMRIATGMDARGKVKARIIAFDCRIAEAPPLKAALVNWNMKTPMMMKPT